MLWADSVWCSRAEVDELCGVRRQVQLVEPRQGLLDVIGFKSHGAEFAAELRQLWTRIASPVVFIDEYEHFKHGANIHGFPR
jgi:hypothetical protein